MSGHRKKKTAHIGELLPGLLKKMKKNKKGDVPAEAVEVIRDVFGDFYFSEFKNFDIDRKKGALRITVSDHMVEQELRTTDQNLLSGAVDRMKKIPGLKSIHRIIIRKERA